MISAVILHAEVLKMTGEVTVVQSGDAGKLVSLWLHGRSVHTQRAYKADVTRFLAFVGKGLDTVTLADAQAFADSLGGLAPASQHRVLSAVKSLLAFGHRIGVLPVNAAAPLRLPPLRNRLTERILTEDEVHRMIALEPNQRNAILLRLLYASGERVSELCALTWKDIAARTGNAGQVTLYGKGGKTRTVLLSPSTWAALITLQGEILAAAPVFVSRKGGHLDPSQVLRIVQAAARRAGISKAVSPHWMRHAHASHALDRGAPIHLVQATLGHASVATTGRYLHARPNDSSARYLGV